MKYQPPDTTEWRDVRALRAQERRAAMFPWFVLCAYLFPLVLILLAFALGGTTLGVIVAFVVMSWRAL